MLMNKILELKASIIASVALAGVVLGTILAFGGFSPLFSGFAKQSYVLQLNQQLTTRVKRLSTQAAANYADIRREEKVHFCAALSSSPKALRRKTPRTYNERRTSNRNHPGYRGTERHV